MKYKETRERTFKPMKRLLLLGFGLIFLLAACGGEDEVIESNLESQKQVQDFDFTTQDDDTLSLSDLEGDWWIADFIFTNCTTVCLPMTSNMVKLQDMMKDEDLDAQLVSFSVEPEYDTPEVLTKYAGEYGADLSNWNFLTGYDFETIKELSIKSFRSMLMEAPPGDDQVTHGTSFYLVDPEGKVIKKYSGVEPEGIEEIIEDLKKIPTE